ncbi:MAG TPA: nucleotide exchange factor GrpE [Streptosporangiaceae bacterium]|nr:nucleotide exchange factor GrpE [Streptosporangiaceae bacterium]
MSASEEENQGPVIRDRRRIDPVTGQPRQPAQAPGAAQAARGAGQPRPGKHSVSKPGSLRPEAAGAGAVAGKPQAGPGGAGAGEAGSAGPQPSGDGAAPNGGSGDVAVKLAERTADLQRVQAEYANYRKRVDRDRAAVREQALASVVAELLPVLDDIGRAREHDELTGGFKAVAEALEAAAGKLGLTTFGKAGEAFDPNVHEALMHSYSADVTEPTCVQVLQPGYKVGERILRPARVAVAEPTDPAGARTASGESSGEDGTDDASGEADAASADDHAPDDGD